MSETFPDLSRSYLYCSMKFFILLFSFYMLTLSCLPCGDADDCNEKEKKEIAAASTQTEHDHESESCTPFCSCSCCSSAGFYPVFNQPKQISPMAEKGKSFRRADDFNSYFAHTVWQPPRT